jgi:hypothetical protein
MVEEAGAGEVRAGFDIAKLEGVSRNVFVGARR